MTFSGTFAGVAGVGEGVEKQTLPGQASPMLIIKPARSAQILMACFGAPFILLAIGVGAFLTASGDVGDAVYAAVPLLIGSWCLGEISTLRLSLSADRLWLSRWWHTRWAIARDQVELRDAWVGDVPILPGLHVIDRASGAKIGEIISVQFRPEDLKSLMTLLETPGDQSVR